MKAYMVADAHLDTQWNWDVQTTIRDYVWNTLNQNLFLLKHYPDYVFNFEGGVKYSWMKEYYPLQYEELKKYIAEGRWHITGSGWDANETILCSPESWIRNILLGQTFYRKEFGTEGTDVFLPDCFGFPYVLPTLAHHCGLIGFMASAIPTAMKTTTSRTTDACGRRRARVRWALPTITTAQAISAGRPPSLL